MFSSNINKYLLIFIAVSITSYLYTKLTPKNDSTDEYELIKKYLLNDSPLYGFNRPKLWIHTKYEINSRKWKSFGSRNTTNLNQPYLHLTIKSIINHCGNDFNICLIDDESFSKLLPSWDIDLKQMAEPKRTQYRELAMLELVYYYGGMVVPNSFVCTKNLKGLYDEGLNNGKIFACETINHHFNLLKQTNHPVFIPSTYFIGGNKNDETMKNIIEFAKGIYFNPHFSSEEEVIGKIAFHLNDLQKENKINIISGKLIGIKTNKNKPILLEDLLEENYLDLSENKYGIYIPEDQILNRTKYQWFSVLSEEEILESKLIIAKYLKASIISSTDIYSKSTDIKSVVSI